MNSLRFNHVFLALLIFCAASAFILPRFVDPARAPVQNIFYPVSRPTRLIARWLADRFSHQPVPDVYSPDQPRADSDIRLENLEYHQMVVNLTAQLQQMAETEQQRKEMGPLRNFCTPFKVTAGDTGTSQSLVIGGTTLDRLKEKMPVVFPGGLVGRLDLPGLVGTRVRLITDRGFHMTGVFKRYSKLSNGSPGVLSLSKEQCLVTGAGDNSLIVVLMDPELNKKIEINDWLVLDDSDWPAVTQSEQIGRVASAPKPSHTNLGFDEVRLQPATNLMKLNEVMVVTK